MSLPASGKRFALAIKSRGTDMPGTLLISRKASDFEVNTERPDALQLPPHFAGCFSAQDSKSTTDGGFDETSLNTSADASIA